MSFTAVSAGDLIKASIANANWRHVGRLGTDMIPISSTGISVSDGSLDLGSLAYPWGNLYLDTGKNLYIGGSLVDIEPTTKEPFRIVSGNSESDGYPSFLEVVTSSTSAKLNGATTDFVYVADDTEVTVTSDITFSSLNTAPAANNTAAINDTIYNDQIFSKTEGEFGETWLNCDTVGSEITSIDATIQAFKITNDGGTTEEYLFGYWDDTNDKLYAFKRGIAGSDRIVFKNETGSVTDYVTLLQANYLFLNKDGSTTYKSTTYPVYQSTSPTSPASGDWYFNTLYKLWYRYSGAAWVQTDAVWLGTAICDDTECVAVEPNDYNLNWKDDYEVDIEYSTATYTKIKIHNLNVAGVNIETKNNYGFEISLGTVGDRESGVAEVASTLYYIYVDKFGKAVYSDVCPRGRDLKRGFYHPQKYWRCIGTVYNDSSNNIVPFVINDNFTIYKPIYASSDSNNAIESTGNTSSYALYSFASVPPIATTVQFQIYTSGSGNCDMKNYIKYRGDTYGRLMQYMSTGGQGNGVLISTSREAIENSTIYSKYTANSSTSYMSIIGYYNEF